MLEMDSFESFLLSISLINFSLKNTDFKPTVMVGFISFLSLFSDEDI